MISYKHREDLVKPNDKFLYKEFESKHNNKFLVIGINDNYKNLKSLIYICKFIDTGYETLAFSGAIKNGNVKDYYYKSVYNIGYLGDYKGKEKKHFLYKYWIGMMGRCYNKNSPDYRENCEVDKRWHCFNTFIEDSKNLLGYDDFVKHKEVKYSLDKDFIKQGNNIYSKDNCCFMPQDLNSFILNTEKNREYKFEGVYLRKDNLKFRSSIRFNGKTKSLIQSDNPITPHDAYWKAKQNIANEYFNGKYSFINDNIKQITFKRIELKSIESKNELNRAIKDGYFDKLKEEYINDISKRSIPYTINID